MEENMLITMREVKKLVSIGLAIYRGMTIYHGMKCKKYLSLEDGQFLFVIARG
jgi:hypothetical protein